MLCLYAAISDLWTEYHSYYVLHLLQLSGTHATNKGASTMLKAFLTDLACVPNLLQESLVAVRSSSRKRSTAVNQLLISAAGFTIHQAAGVSATSCVRNRQKLLQQLLAAMYQR